MKDDALLQDAKLQETAKRLGAAAANRLDVEATARKVVERLREPAARRTVWIHETWLRVAAALVILVGSALALRQVWSGGEPNDHLAHLVADDLRDLSTEELRAVLTSFDELVTQDSVAVPESSNDLRELDAQQLRAVLRSLEG